MLSSFVVTGQHGLKKLIAKQAVVNIYFYTSKNCSQWLHICEYAFCDLFLPANPLSTNKDYLVPLSRKSADKWSHIIRWVSIWCGGVGV